MLVAFILTMPGCPTWNGRWSGDGKLYAQVKRYKKQPRNLKIDHDYQYRWSDGWMVNIEVKLIDSREASKIRKASKGMFGYEWMISSIEAYGEILADHEIKQRHLERKDTTL